MPAPRPQPRGESRTLQIWLIVAFAVALIFAVMFFVQFADQAKLTEERQQARDELAKVISRQEQTTYGKYFDQAGRAKTMVALMGQALQNLAQLAVGAPTPEESDLEAVRDKAETLFSSIRKAEGIPDPTPFQPGANLHDAAKTLFALYSEAMEQNAQLTQQNAALAKDKEELSKNLSAVTQTFDAGSQEMKASLGQVESERDSFREAKDGEIEGFQKQIAQLRDEKDTSERRLRNRITELDQAVASRDKAISTLQDKLDELAGPAIDAEAVAAEPDGRIIQSIPTDPLVSIDLGRRNHLTLGMTFAVFAPPVPGQPREAAKATIEVVGIQDTTAECRVRSEAPDNPILEGDLIANAIYDPHRPIRFVIAGEFDLDYDGRIDVDAHDQLAALITGWGGQVADQLDERIDFVVIGTKPPVTPLTEEATPEQQERHKVQQAREDEYLALRSESKALSIPLLTQAQFYRFIGQTTRSAGDMRNVRATF